MHLNLSTITISNILLIILRLNTYNTLAFNWKSSFSMFTNKSVKDISFKIISSNNIPEWDLLTKKVHETDVGLNLLEQSDLRSRGLGNPHTDAKYRLFGTSDEPRITFYRDTAAWCPYCQKVWILLEEKKIPYKVEKINMRSYGDKPAEFLRMVPGGLLPAIVIDNKRVQTESLEIMLNLDNMFKGPAHKSLWPEEGSDESARAMLLMKLERQLFGLWCNLVFSGSSSGANNRQRFENCMDQVENQLKITSSPWFLNDFSIVDLTFITHVERMAASISYWAGFQIRGDGRWPALERWMAAFEQMPSYMATKSDYYTHIMDIPPQYGPGYFIDEESRHKYAPFIDGRKGWELPLPPINQDNNIETVLSFNDPGEDSAKIEAAFKIISNKENIAKFALRGAGIPGAKRFQAPLADPYATPALEYTEDMDSILRYVVHALLTDYRSIPELTLIDSKDTKMKLSSSVQYLRDRIGVPRDMSYPAARQLRAHLNWIIAQL